MSTDELFLHISTRIGIGLLALTILMMIATAGDRILRLVERGCLP